MQKIGDRMKANYEDRQRHYLTRRVPVIVRVDGKAFHTYTRGMDKPFDMWLVNAMVASAMLVAEDMQGFKLAYVQSDEVSFLLTDYDTLSTEAWFDYNKSKVETITASAMTAHFNRKMDDGHRRLAMFDARAFNIPREEVSNYFLWRMMDWERNSVAMYCSEFYSHKQMHGKGKADQHEMLHAVGKNWTRDLVPQLRNGTLLKREDGKWKESVHALPVFSEIDEIVNPLVNCDANTGQPEGIPKAMSAES